MWINTRQRSQEPEIMDDFAMEGETLRDALDEIALINRWLGGNQITLKGVQFLLRNVEQRQPIRIWDLGCGNGDLLRVVAKWGRRAGVAMELKGIDANADTIDYARKLSADYPEISYVQTILPDEQLQNEGYDIVLCTLFLHHFSTDAAVDLLRRFNAQAALGMVINDLQRSRMAYFLFSLLTFFHPNKMVRTDGLTSILRGFQRSELEMMAQQVGDIRSSIRWRWAFRYQWIIQPQEGHKKW